MTATTAQAATTAGVTIATIRTWCRRGAVAATKHAGRWLIDTASLARRIAIGAARRPRRRTPVNLDLTRTYTYEDTWDGRTVVALEIRTRARTGITTITGLAALLGDELDAIPEYDRQHVIEVLRTAAIRLRPQPIEVYPEVAHEYRREGRIHTTYYGAKGLPVSVVLDLGERLHDQLTRDAAAPAPAADAPPILLTSRTVRVRGHIAAIGPADVLRAAFEAGAPVTLSGRWAGERVYLGHRRTTYNDGLSVETIGEDRTWEHQGMQVAAYLLDLARLDGAPRLAALVREVTAREAAAAAQAEARARAEEDAYLNQTDH